VKTTSSAVIGEPSEKRASSRSSKVAHSRSSGISTDFATRPYSESASSSALTINESNRKSLA
jgi:hypothetical protein